VKELLEFIARNLVEDEAAVQVTEVEGRRGPILQLSVAPDDMGKVIGRGGRTARAIRAVMRAAGTRDDVIPTVEIVG